MKAFQVISTLLLIGVLSSVINAQIGDKSGEMPNPFFTKKLGTVLIRSNPKARNENNILCSGVLLDRDTVLTVASCVEGQKYEDLAIEIPVRNGDKFTYEYPVNVREVSINPNYKKGEYRYNLALLYLKGDNCKFSIDKFTLPPFHYTPEFILENNIETRIDEWKNYTTQTPYLFGHDERITTNYAICDAVNLAKYSYCAMYIYGDSRMTKEDIGTPLYIPNSGAKFGKIVIGLYTGTRANEGTWGHLYIDVYESLTWVFKTLKERK